MPIGLCKRKLQVPLNSRGLYHLRHTRHFYFSQTLWAKKMKKNGFEIEKEFVSLPKTQCLKSVWNKKSKIGCWRVWHISWSSKQYPEAKARDSFQGRRKQQSTVKAISKLKFRHNKHAAMAVVCRCKIEEHPNFRSNPSSASAENCRAAWLQWL